MYKTTQLGSAIYTIWGMLSESSYGTYLTIGNGLGEQARSSRPLLLSPKAHRDRENMLYKHHQRVNSRIRTTITNGGRDNKVLFWGKVGPSVTAPEILFQRWSQICSYSHLVLRRSDFGFTGPEFCVQLCNLGQVTYTF